MTFFCYYLSNLWEGDCVDKKYCIYVHTNLINNKKYVGITSQTIPERRWQNGEGYKHNSYFYTAIKK